MDSVLGSNSGSTRMFKYSQTHYLSIVGSLGLVSGECSQFRVIHTYRWRCCAGVRDGCASGAVRVWRARAACAACCATRPAAAPRRLRSVVLIW